MLKNMKNRDAALIISVICAGVGCVSGWKVQGGPKTCVEMCKGWDLEFAGMVGVGDQSRGGDGASACVCQVPKLASNALTRRWVLRPSR